MTVMKLFQAKAVQCFAKLLATGLLLFSAAAPDAKAQVTYIYTDAQGTPLAEADSQGRITHQIEYTPYGAPTNARGLPDGPSYTSHVGDPEIALIYMQQRYYDYEVGDFISIDLDPVDIRSGANFCRYCYANSNPFSYIDPDGRNAILALAGVMNESWNALNGGEFNGAMVLGALKDGYNGEGDGLYSSAFEDATAIVPFPIGSIAKLGRFAGVLKGAARELGASSSEIRSAGSAIIRMLRESGGFAESTVGRSIKNLDVALGVDSAKSILTKAGFEVGTAKGGAETFTKGGVKFTFAVSPSSGSTIYVAAGGKELLKIRLKDLL